MGQGQGLRSVGKYKRILTTQKKTNNAYMTKKNRIKIHGINNAKARSEEMDSMCFMFLELSRKLQK